MLFVDFDTTVVFGGCNSILVHYEKEMLYK